MNGLEFVVLVGSSAVCILAAAYVAQEVYWTIKVHRADKRMRRLIAERDLDLSEPKGRNRLGIKEEES